MIYDCVKFLDSSLIFSVTQKHSHTINLDILFEKSPEIQSLC